MRSNVFVQVFFFFGSVILLNISEAWCAGFDNNDVGLRGMSMATAYHGIADDGSAIYYNPAGLALIDPGTMNVEAYTYVIFTKFEYEATTPAGTTKSKSTEKPVIPGGFITQSFDRWGVGLGLEVPYGGGGVVYKNFSGTGNTLEASAGFFGVSMAAAVEVVRHYLAVGITPTVYFGVMESKLSPDLTSDMRVSSKNSGYAGIGASLGVMSEPIEKKLKLGLVFRSPVRMKMDGTVTVTSSALPEPMKSDTTMDFMVPMELTLGIGATPIPTLTLGLTGSVIFHGMMEEMTVTTTSESPLTGEKVTDTTESETHYKHNFRVAFGGEYMFIKQLGARAGLQFIQSPTKDKGLVPTSNDVSQLIPTFGLVARFVDFFELGIAGAYVHGIDKSRKSEMSMPQADGTVVSVPLTEKFYANHWILLAGLRFNWDFIR